MQMTSHAHYPYFLAGTWSQTTAKSAAIRNPYNDELVGMVQLGDAAVLEQAIQAAVNARPVLQQLAGHERAAILRGVAQQLEAQAEDFARIIAAEAGKPIKHARAEVQRGRFTFAYAAEEATRIASEIIHTDAFPAGAGRMGVVRRFPVGPVAAITPFNFPLNLVAHKLAPAIAAGCPLVLKPAPQTPITALKLAKLIHAAGLPPGGLSVLPLDLDDAAALIDDDRFKLLTFTGGPQAGWMMKQRAGHKRVLLELGGNAGVLIHHDADLAHAVARCVAGGFAYAGQSCISVQRIVVHADVYPAFLEQFVAAVQQLRVGDPFDEQSDLSSVINDAAAQRIAQWLAEAQAAGAEIVTGGGVRGRLIEPTVIVNAGPDLKVNCQEVFAPVVTVQPYTDFADALRFLNDSPFGLQAGIFTNDMRLIMHAYSTLEVGGIIVNDSPSWRVDHMPYGGVKQSGLGREGLRYAIEEMTEPRLLVLPTG